MIFRLPSPSARRRAPRAPLGLAWMLAAPPLAGAALMLGEIALAAPRAAVEWTCLAALLVSAGAPALVFEAFVVGPLSDLGARLRSARQSPPPPMRRPALSRLLSDLAELTDDSLALQRQASRYATALAGCENLRAAGDAAIGAFRTQTAALQFSPSDDDRRARNGQLELISTALAALTDGLARPASREAVGLLEARIERLAEAQRRQGEQTQAAFAELRTALALATTDAKQDAKSLAFRQSLLYDRLNALAGDGGQIVALGRQAAAAQETNAVRLAAMSEGVQRLETVVGGLTLAANRGLDANLDSALICDRLDLIVKKLAGSADITILREELAEIRRGREPDLSSLGSQMSALTEAVASLGGRLDAVEIGEKPRAENRPPVGPDRLPAVEAPCADAIPAGSVDSRFRKIQGLIGGSSHDRSELILREPPRRSGAA